MLPLSEADQLNLLRMARESLIGYLESGDIAKPPESSESLCQACGVFVTLRKGKHLRGCIGVVETDKPLYVTVRECAVLSATSDPRFSKVTKQEVAGLNIEISVLSPPFDIAPEVVEIGNHGLIISQGAARGLLLPQVAVQWKWDREQFLQETCRKAGLPPDAWQHGAKIRAFTAQIFEESHSATSSHPAA
jgi:uncharacterized protein